QADELGADDLRPARRRFALDRPDDLIQAGRLPILDVHAHLYEPGLRQLEAEGAHAWKAAVPLADDRGDLPSRRKLAAQVDVQRDQRSTRADEHRAPAIVEPTWPEIGRERSRLHAPPEPIEAARPEIRRPEAGCKLAVEEHRQRELVADAL